MVPMLEKEMLTLTFGQLIERQGGLTLEAATQIAQIRAALALEKIADHLDDVTEITSSGRVAISIVRRES